MRTLVIYDNTGKIYLMLYGADNAPQGLQSIWVDIPDGAQLQKIDVTNPDKPEPVFSYLPDSDIGRLQKEVASITEELSNTQIALTEQYEANLALQTEVTNTQVALAELYEEKGV